MTNSPLTFSKKAPRLVASLLVMSWVLGANVSAHADTAEAADASAAAAASAASGLEQPDGTDVATEVELEPQAADVLAVHQQAVERIAELETSEAESTAELERLAKRITELETAKRAQEEATRTIIRQTLDTLGARINEFVIFGGTLEVAIGSQEEYRSLDEADLILETAQLDFEIQVNDWTIASVILEYVDGSDFAGSVEGDEASVDRINIDTAYLTLGDRQRFWPSAAFGRMVVPFGISTGDPVADVLTLEDPLTVATFEMTEVAILLHASFPTPPPRPVTSRPGPPPVKPKVLAPLIGKLSRAVGYKPYPVPPPRQNYITSTPPPPPYSLTVFTFNGTTFRRPRDEESWTPTRHVGATAGLRARGSSWSVDLDLDWSSSVFDSDFLGLEYRNFLDQIGLVPGMAWSVKASRGPAGLVAEWNGALEHTSFEDDAGANIRMRPSAWQISIGYQLDWNPTIEAIGSQGTYLALGYSESRDMAGVTVDFGGQEERVGFVSRRRFLASAGEWVLDGLRVAIEYSYMEDYPVHEGGTGRSANGIASMLTMEW